MNQSSVVKTLPTVVILVAIFAMPSKPGERSVLLRQGQPQITRTAEKEGIHLNLLIEKSLYSPGEMVRVTATAENLNTTPGVLWMASMDDSPIQIFVDTPFLGPQTLRNPGDPQAVRDAMGSAVLEPGQKLVREVSWDQMMPSELKGPVPTPPGQYSVNVVMNLGKYDSSGNNRSLRVAAAITIEGSRPIISMDEALRSAISHPQVSSWFESHGGRFVLRSPRHTTYFVLSQGKLQELPGNPNTGGGLGSGAGGLANCAMHLEPGPIWRLNMAAHNKDGSYSEMHVLLNATDGKVLVVE
jgi:hypothetical protein